MMQKHQNIIFHLREPVAVTYLAGKQFIIACNGLMLIPEIHGCLLIVLFRTMIKWLFCFAKAFFMEMSENEFFKEFPKIC